MRKRKKISSGWIASSLRMPLEWTKKKEKRSLVVCWFTVIVQHACTDFKNSDRLEKKLCFCYAIRVVRFSARRRRRRTNWFPFALSGRWKRRLTRLQSCIIIFLHVNRAAYTEKNNNDTHSITRHTPRNMTYECILCPHTSRVLGDSQRSAVNARTRVCVVGYIELS